jgi:hypothetical protein
MERLDQGHLRKHAIGGLGFLDLVYISEPRWSNGKKHSLRAGVLSSIVIYGGQIRSSEAAMGGGARSAPFAELMGPKRRVRAAHERPKPTSSLMFA